MLSANISPTLEEKEASKDIELDHEYEILDQYNRDQQFQLIQCPAYIPVVQANQQLETSTSHPSTATNDKDMELVADMSVYDTPSPT